MNCSITSEQLRLLSPRLSPWRAKSTKCQPTPAKSDLSVLLGIARKWRYDDVAAWDRKTSIPGSNPGGASKLKFS
jgi:hypothetical protein